MEFISNYSQVISVILGILIISSILLQTSGASIGSGLGGGDTAINHTRRGFEKFLFYFTIFISIIFVGMILLELISSK